LLQILQKHLYVEIEEFGKDEWDRLEVKKILLVLQLPLLYLILLLHLNKGSKMVEVVEVVEVVELLLHLVLLKVQVEVKGVILEVQVKGGILEVQVGVEVGVAVAGVEVAVAEEDSLEDPARHDAKRRRLEEPHAASCRMVAASARENQSVKRHYL
jgi:hypothetical protein